MNEKRRGTTFIMVKIGEQAPDFDVVNQDGKRVQLSDFRGKKVVLFAFPKAGTMGCNNQACEFRDEFTNITCKNAVVLGVSADTPADLCQWKNAKKLPYDLLSDTNHALLDAYGAWGLNVLGIVKVPQIIRSYWVIDENGVIIDMQVGVMPRASVEKAIKALDAAEAVKN